MQPFFWLRLASCNILYILFQEVKFVGCFLRRFKKYECQFSWNHVARVFTSTLVVPLKPNGISSLISPFSFGGLWVVYITFIQF